MTTFDKIVIELIWVAINLGLAKWEAWRFDKQQRKIDHMLVAVSYGVGIIGAYIWVSVRFGLSWSLTWISLSLIALHFPLFSIALNRFRTPPRQWDYHNTSDTSGSKFDLWLGKWYDEVLFLSVAAWVGLQFLIFKK